MKDLTKYRSDLKSEYIRVGTEYHKFVIRLTKEGEECGMYLRPWNARTMKDDDINFDEVPKYDGFYDGPNPDYPHLFSLQGFKKMSCKIHRRKTPLMVYKWVGIESAG